MPNITNNSLVSRSGFWRPEEAAHFYVGLSELEDRYHIYLLQGEAGQEIHGRKLITVMVCRIRAQWATFHQNSMVQPDLQVQRGDFLQVNADA